MIKIIIFSKIISVFLKKTKGAPFSECLALLKNRVTFKLLIYLLFHIKKSLKFIIRNRLGSAQTEQAQRIKESYLNSETYGFHFFFVDVTWHFIHHKVALLHVLDPNNTFLQLSPLALLHQRCSRPLQTFHCLFHLSKIP